jgi:hypothetical protein
MVGCCLPPSLLPPPPPPFLLLPPPPLLLLPPPSLLLLLPPPAVLLVAAAAVAMLLLLLSSLSLLLPPLWLSLLPTQLLVLLMPVLLDAGAAGQWRHVTVFATLFSKQASRVCWRSAMPGQRRKRGISRHVQLSMISRYARSDIRVLDQAAIARNRKEVQARLTQSLNGTNDLSS